MTGLARLFATLIVAAGAWLATQTESSGAATRLFGVADARSVGAPQESDGTFEGPPEAGLSISADGRYVAFASRADDVSAEDNDSVVNIFVRDLQANTTTLVSRASGASGAAADLWSVTPSISADGRYVAFESVAHNLSPVDHDLANIFVRDLQTNTTTLVSRASGVSGAAADGGSVAPSISADGDRVAFQSLAFNLGPDVATVDVFVRDLPASTTTLASRATGSPGLPADSYSEAPSLSADGRFVAFESDARNLGPDAVGGAFVRDLDSETTTLVSRASGALGAPAAPLGPGFEPSIAGDGDLVAFSSQADNLSPADNDLVGTFCFSIPHGTQCENVHVADVFVRDLQMSSTAFASRASGAAGAAADFGGDLGAAYAEPVSHEPSVSADGRFVAFSSAADNLSAEDDDDVRDIYVRDLQANATTFVSRASGPAGEAFHDDSAQPSISADGHFVAFGSRRCLEGETKGTAIYVRDLQSETTTRVGLDPNTDVCPLASPPPGDYDAPPETRITKRPKNKLLTGTAKAKVKFVFEATEVDSTFECRRDDRAWKDCTSPRRYKDRPGKHRFRVRASDLTGNTDASPAKDKFKVVRK